MKLSLIGFLGVMLVGGAALAAPASAPGRPPQSLVGVTTHFAHHKGIVEEGISLIRQAGLTSIRDELYWGAVERAKGQLQMPGVYRDYVQAASAAGIAPLCVLDFGNNLYDGGGYPRSPEAVAAFARYAAFCASELKAYHPMFQVWNEWEGGCGMRPEFVGQGDLGTYLKLLNATFPAIKAADRTALVLTNPSCNWRDSYLAYVDSGMLKSCDRLDLHHYPYWNGEPAPEPFIDGLDAMERDARARNGGREVPMTISETGWPTDITPIGRSQAEVADYVARFTLQARTKPFIKGFWFYDFQDDQWSCHNNEFNFGLVRPDLTPKSSYAVLKDLLPTLNQARFVKRLHTPDPDAWALLFKAADGRDVLALWSTRKTPFPVITNTSSRDLTLLAAGYRDADCQFLVETDSPPGTAVSLTLLGHGSVTRRLGRSGTAAGGRLSVTARGRPVLVCGNLGRVRLADVRLRPTRTEAPGLLPQQAILVARASAPAPGRTYALESAGGAAGSGHFSIRWEERRIMLEVVVKDRPAAAVKVSLFPFEPGTSIAAQDGHNDFTLEPGEAAPVVIRTFGRWPMNMGKTTEIDLSVRRSPAATTYRVEIPPTAISHWWARTPEGEAASPTQAVYLPAFKPGMAIGFALAVGDGQERLHWGGAVPAGDGPLLGYLHYATSGIGIDPANYDRWLILSE
ncbi:MAG: hypothetical protein WC708_12040 [Lentisphaeria bacterium]